MSTPARIVFHAEPLTFDRDSALTYTGLAPKLFDMLESSGRLHGKPHGRNGSKLYQRSELETVVAALFGDGGPANDLDSEL